MKHLLVVPSQELDENVVTVCALVLHSSLAILCLLTRVLQGAESLLEYNNPEQKKKNHKSNIVRFGLMWKCDDMVVSFGLAYRAHILDVMTEPLLLGGYLLGGVIWTNVIVSVWGLEQPHAGNRVVITITLCRPFTTLYS
ncbi:unnamed protein product (mitochondrion) [Musa textilis]